MGTTVLDVKRLRLLVELSRRGTIAAVAEALSYSPSAVSQQLAVLEKEAGTPLLEPVGRRVKLTTEGELLVGHASVVLAELETAQANLAVLRSEVTGTVRAAAFQSAVLTLMPTVILGLQERYPALRLEVTEMEPEASIPALVAGDFDLVLGEEYPNQPLPQLPGVDRTTLLRDPLTLAVPTAWGRIRFADLANRPFAMEPEGTTSRRWASAYCRAHGVEPDVRYTSTDLQIHLRMVRHGLAAAFLPRLADPGPPDGVTAVPLEGRPARRIFSATRTAARRRPALAALVDALRDAVDGG